MRIQSFYYFYPQHQNASLIRPQSIVIVKWAKAVENLHSYLLRIDTTFNVLTFVKNQVFKVYL